jgi:competence protein ComEC
VHDPSLHQGIACDPSGCIGKLADGAMISYVLTPEAYEEDCARTALVVASGGEPPADCRSIVIARTLWRQRGALALRRTGSDQRANHGADFVIDSARPRNFDRPWSPAAPAPREPTSSVTANDFGEGEGAGRASRDATPRREDIEADQ